MVVRKWGWLMAASLLLTVVNSGCDARALDPGMNPTTGTGGQAGGPPISPPPPEIDLASMLKQVSGPDKLLIVGTNAGAVTSTTANEPITVFIKDPETLTEAA